MAEIVKSNPKTEPMIQLRVFLDNRANEIKTALPAHISPERFIRVVLTAAQLNPEILACDRQSLWNACMRAANDGLLPDGAEGAIVPFKSKATWIPMYQGLIKKFRNSGEFKWITAGIVYVGEEYDHWIDETGEHFKHRPSDDHTAQIRRVYAIATTQQGGAFIADLSPAEIHKRRTKSRATREDSPWQQWPEEMMKKTALRVLSKLLPKSSDIDILMRRDEEELYNVEREPNRLQSPFSKPADTVAALDAFGASDASGEPAALEGGRAEPQATGLRQAESAATQADRPEERPPTSTPLEQAIEYERQDQKRKER